MATQTSRAGRLSTYGKIWPPGLALPPARALVWRIWSMVMTTRHETFAGMPPVRLRPGPNRRHFDGTAKPAPRREALAQPGLLQLAIDAVGQLVESFVDGNFLRDHLLQGSRPFGRQIKE